MFLSTFHPITKQKNVFKCLNLGNYKTTKSIFVVGLPFFLKFVFMSTFNLFLQNNCIANYPGYLITLRA